MDRAHEWLAVEERVAMMELFLIDLIPSTLISADRSGGMFRVDRVPVTTSYPGTALYRSLLALWVVPSALRHCPEHSLHVKDSQDVSR